MKTKFRTPILLNADAHDWITRAARARDVAESRYVDALLQLIGGALPPLPAEFPPGPYHPHQFTVCPRAYHTLLERAADVKNAKYLVSYVATLPKFQDAAHRVVAAAEWRDCRFLAVDLNSEQAAKLVSVLGDASPSVWWADFLAELLSAQGRG